MARPTSFSSGDALPKYVSATHALDVSWKASARCRSTGPGPWFLEDSSVDPTHAGLKASPKEIGDACVALCEVCPVQWDCFHYAMDGRQDFGIWSVRQADRRWVRLHVSPWKEMARDAEVAGLSVAEWVALLRAGF